MATKPEKSKKQQYHVFSWKGKDNQGQPVKGELQALNLNLAKAQLRKQGITAEKIRKKTPAPFGLGEKKITTREITLFTRQLSTMIRAGVPLVQSLNVVAEGLENPAMQKIILNIRNEVADGNMLSMGLRKHPKYFDKLFCNLVEAGERSGSLDAMLDRVAIYKEKTDRIKAKIKKALYYPVAVMAIGVVVMLILLLKVVPQFESLFNSFNAELPMITQVVIDLSEFVQQWWWLIIGILVLTPILLIRSYKSSELFAYRVDALTLRLPVIGQIVRKSSIARFSRTLSTSFTSGVPLVESMAAAAGAAGNRVYSRAVFQARDNISVGQQLNFALKTTHVFPAMVTQMVSIGEESGSLDTMLDKVAGFYEEEVDDAVEGMTTLLEPIVVAVLGVMVGGLVLAMYLPIFKMGSLF
ncbi:type II secretion system F family protein [Oceanospirillum sanctuarii]|uniref:type II secretion system F family protein n=1 Tax=Oceanospirillum sanctuarii TaxID=1434821 RepID=UPI000A399CE7|nr:type II secretion system F family protein [Oceanospirillum sanctuarii]